MKTAMMAQQMVKLLAVMMVVYTVAMTVVSSVATTAGKLDDMTAFEMAA